MHNGRVAITSTPGKGTQVSVVLPRGRIRFFTGRCPRLNRVRGTSLPRAVDDQKTAPTTASEGPEPPSGRYSPPANRAASGPRAGWPQGTPPALVRAAPRAGPPPPAPQPLGQDLARHGRRRRARAARSARCADLRRAARLTAAQSTHATTSPRSHVPRHSPPPPSRPDRDPASRSAITARCRGGQPGGRDDHRPGRGANRSVHAACDRRSARGSSSMPRAGS